MKRVLTGFFIAAAVLFFAWAKDTDSLSPSSFLKDIPPSEPEEALVYQARENLLRSVVESAHPRSLEDFDESDITKSLQTVAKNLSGVFESGFLQLSAFDRAIPIQEAVAKFLSGRPELGVKDVSELSAVLSAAAAKAWKIESRAPQDNWMNFAGKEGNLFAESPVFLEEVAPGGVRVIVSEPMWKTLTPGERISLILGAYLKNHFRQTPHDAEAISQIIKPALEAAFDAKWNEAPLISELKEYGNMKWNLLKAGFKGDMEAYRQARTALLNQIQALHEQTKALSSGTLTMLFEQARMELVKEIGTDPDIPEMVKKIRFPGMEKMQPENLFFLCLPNPMEIRQQVGFSFSAGQLKVIKEVTGETARDLYSSEGEVKVADKQKEFMDDVLSWNLASFLPEEPDPASLQEVVFGGLFNLSRMEHAGGYFHPGTRKLYFPDLKNLLNLRIFLKHELVHYLAFKKILKFDFRFEWTTTAIHVLEAVEYAGEDKLGLLRSSMGPLVDSLFEKGKEAARKGAPGLLFAQTAQGPVISLEYLKSLVEKVYHENGYPTEGLSVEDGWDREIGVVLAGIMYARRHDQEDQEPYLIVLKKFFDVIHETMRPPTPEEQQWVDKTLIPKLKAYADFTLDGKTVFAPIDPKDPVRQWKVEVQGQKKIVRYVPEEIWPRDYYGADPEARQQRAEDNAFAALSETLFRHKHSRLDQAMPQAVAKGISDENKSLFEMLWKNLETIEILREGLSMYRGLEAAGDDLKSAGTPGFSGFTSTNLGRQIYNTWKERFSIRNADVAETLLAGLPYPIQFLNSILYRMVMGEANDPRLKNKKVLDAIDRTREHWQALMNGTAWSENAEAEFEKIWDKIWPEFLELHKLALKEEEERRVYDRLRRDNLKGDEPSWDDLSDEDKEALREFIERALDQMSPEEREALKEAAKDALEQEYQDAGEMAGQACAQPAPGPAGAQAGGQVSPEGGEGAAQPGMEGGAQRQPETAPGQAVQPAPGPDLTSLNPDQLKEYLEDLKGEVARLEGALSDMQSKISELGNQTGEVSRGTEGVTGAVSDENAGKAGEIADASGNLENKAGELDNKAKGLAKDAGQVRGGVERSGKDAPSPELADKANRSAKNMEGEAGNLSKETEELLRQIREAAGQARDLKAKIDEKAAGSTVRQHLDKLKENLEKARGKIDQVAAQAAKTSGAAGELGKDLQNRDNSKPLRMDNLPSNKGKKGQGKAEPQTSPGQADQTFEPAEPGEPGKEEKAEASPPSFEQILSSVGAKEPEASTDEENVPEFPVFSDPPSEMPSFSEAGETAPTPGTEDLPEGWRENLREFSAAVQMDADPLIRNINRILNPDARVGAIPGFLEGDLDELVDMKVNGTGFTQPGDEKPEDMVVSLYLDLSGSMIIEGRIGQAQYAAFILTKALFELKNKYKLFDVNIRFEVWGFTDMQEPLISFEHSDKVQPSQVEAEIYRMLMKIQPGGENDDVTALQRQWDSLKRQGSSGTKRIGFFVSDSTSNEGENASRMNQIVKDAKNKDNILLFGLGVGSQMCQRLVGSIFEDHAVPVGGKPGSLGSAIIRKLFQLAGVKVADYSWMELVKRVFSPVEQLFIQAGLVIGRQVLLMTQAVINAMREEDIPGYEEYGFKYRHEKGIKYLVHYPKDTSGNRSKTFDYKKRIGHEGDFKPSYLPYSESNEAVLIDMLKRSDKGSDTNAKLDYRSSMTHPMVSEDGERFIRGVSTGALELWNQKTRSLIVRLDKQADFVPQPDWPKVEETVWNGTVRDGKLYLLTATKQGGLAMKTYEQQAGQWVLAENLFWDDESPNGRLVNLMGESGTGKGELLKAAAHLCQKRLVFVSCHKDMGRGDFVYYATYGEEEEGKTGKKYSHLNEAAQWGDWVVLDEFNKVETNVRKELQTSFQERTYERDIEETVAGGSTAIRPISYRWHPDTRVFLTGNPFDNGRLYKVNEYDDAEKRRMETIPVRWQTPSEEVEMLMKLAFPPGTKNSEKEKWRKRFKFFVNWSMKTRLMYLGYSEADSDRMIREEAVYRNPEDYNIKPKPNSKGLQIGRPVSTRVLIALAKGMVRFPLLFENRTVSFVSRYFNYAADDPSVCTREQYANIMRPIKGWKDDLKDKSGKEVKPVITVNDVKVVKEHGVLFLKVTPPPTEYEDAEGKKTARWEALSIELGTKVDQAFAEKQIKTLFSNQSNAFMTYQILVQYQLGTPIVFVGFPGTGKSYFSENTGKLVDGPELLSKTFARGTKYQDVVESRELGQQKKGATGWIRQALVWAMGDRRKSETDRSQRGQIYRAEELSQGPAALLALFNDIMQNGRLLLRDGTEVESGDGCRVWITMNPPGAKTKVTPLSGELLDRCVFFETTDMEPVYEVAEYKSICQHKLDEDFLGVLNKQEVPVRGLIKAVTDLRVAYDRDPSCLPVRPSLGDMDAFLKELVMEYEFFPEADRGREIFKRFMINIHADPEQYPDRADAIRALVRKALVDAGILKSITGKPEDNLTVLLEGRPLIKEELELIEKADTGDPDLNKDLDNLQTAVISARTEWAKRIQQKIGVAIQTWNTGDSWDARKDALLLMIQTDRILKLIEEQREHRSEIADVLSVVRNDIRNVVTTFGLGEDFLTIETGYFKNQKISQWNQGDKSMLDRWFRIQLLGAGQKWNRSAEEMNTLMRELKESVETSNLLHEKMVDLWRLEFCVLLLKDSDDFKLKKMAEAGDQEIQSLCQETEQMLAEYDIKKMNLPQEQVMAVFSMISKKLSPDSAWTPELMLLTEGFTDEIEKIPGGFVSAYMSLYQWDSRLIVESQVADLAEKAKAFYEFWMRVQMMKSDPHSGESEIRRAEEEREARQTALELDAASQERETAAQELDLALANEGKKVGDYSQAGKFKQQSTPVSQRSSDRFTYDDIAHAHQWESFKSSNRVSVIARPIGTVLKEITAHMNQPVGMCPDGGENMWVVNSGNNTIAVFDRNNAELNTGIGDKGIIRSDKLKNPQYVVRDRAGNMCVMNADGTIVVFTPDGRVNESAGTQGVITTGINNPYHFKVNDDGDFVAADPGMVGFSQILRGPELKDYSNPEAIQSLRERKQAAEERIAELEEKLAQLSPELAAKRIAERLSREDAAVEDLEGKIRKMEEDGRNHSLFGKPNPEIAYNGIIREGLDSPMDLTFDHAGNVWVANIGYDLNSVTVYSPKGKLLKTIEPTAENKFDGPRTIITDRDGNIWVGNARNSALSVFSPEGDLLRVIEPTPDNGLDGPINFTIDRDGKIWVANERNNTLSVFYPDGGFFRKIEPTGENKLGGIFGLMTDQDGHICVGNSKSPTGTTYTSVFLSDGELFRVDNSITVSFQDHKTKRDKDGNIWACEFQSSAITVTHGIEGKELDPVEMSDLQRQKQKAEARIAELEARLAELSPELAARRIAERLGKEDAAVPELEEKIRETETAMVNYSRAGRQNFAIGLDGTIKGNGLNWCSAMAVDQDGNMWGVNEGDNTISVLMSNGELNSAFGENGIIKGNGLNAPRGIAMDQAGNMWVINHNGTLSVFDRTGCLNGAFRENGIISDVMGGKIPRGIAMDQAGNMWVTASGSCIFVFDQNGQLNTAFGENGIITGDGLEEALGIAGDLDGNMWVLNGNTLSVLDPTGHLNSAFGENGIISMKGTGLDGRLTGIARDLDGNMWVLDRSHYCVFDRTGRLNGSIQKNSKADRVDLKSPQVIAMDQAGDMWFRGTFHVDSIGLAGEEKVEDMIQVLYGPKRKTGELAALQSQKQEAESRIAEMEEKLASVAPELAAMRIAERIAKEDASVAELEGEIREAEAAGVGIEQTDTLNTAIGTSGIVSGNLNSPAAVTQANNGNIWVANLENDSLSVFKSDGTFIKNIPKTDENMLDGPYGLTTDREGNIWVANAGDHSITVFDSNGTFIRNISQTEKNKLSGPAGLTLDKDGNIWVTNCLNNSITVFDSKGKFLKNIPKTDENKLQYPIGLTTDKEGNIWVANHNDHSITVFDSSGEFLRNISQTKKNKLSGPAGLTLDKDGNIWVTNCLNHSLSVFKSDGTFIKNIPQTDENKLRSPSGLTTDREGNLWVTNLGNHSISVLHRPRETDDISGLKSRKAAAESRIAELEEKLAKVSPELAAKRIAERLEKEDAVVSELEGRIREAEMAGIDIDQLGELSTKIGTSGIVSENLNNPTAVTQANNGNIWAANSANHSITVFDSNGTFIRNIPKTNKNKLMAPQGLTTDREGNIWVTNRENHSITVFDSNGTFIRNIPQTKKNMLSGPTGLTLDREGNIWVTNCLNNSITVFDSKGKFLKNIPKTDENKLQYPIGLTTDKEGNIWVANHKDNSITVLDTRGNFLKNIPKTDENKLDLPDGLTVDKEGNIWVANHANSSLTVFDSGGKFLKNIPRTEENKLNDPNGLTTDREGNIWVTNYSIHSLSVFRGSRKQSEDVSVLQSQKQAVEVRIAELEKRLAKVSPELAARRIAERLEKEDAVVSELEGRIREAEMAGIDIDQLGELSTKIGTSGIVSGNLNNPAAVTQANNGNIWAANSANHSITMVDSNGTFIGNIPKTKENKLSAPQGLTTDREGNIWVANSANNSITVFDSNGTFIRNIPQTKKNMLSGPTGLTLDKDGNIWVTNCMNNSITVFDSKGKFLKNIPTTDENKLQYPIGLTTDKEGNIWVANHRDNSITVFDTRGNFLKNIPKTDKNKLDLPCGLTTDKEGNIWVTNIGNNSITVFDSNGIFIGNIPKTDKNKLNTPSGLTTDKEGNIWVANTADNSLSVFHGSRLKSPADIPSLQSEKQAAEQRIAALKAKLEELQARIKPGEPSEEPDVGFDTNRLRPVFSHVFGVQSADTLKHNQMLEKQKELARTAYLELTESAPDVIGDYAAYFEKLFESVGISFPKPEHGFVVSTGEQNRAA